MVVSELTCREIGERSGINLGELRILGKSAVIRDGDIVEEELRITWRNEQREDVSFAEKTFKEYISKGWLAFGEKGGKKTQIFTFDPDLDKITLSPLLVGG